MKAKVSERRLCALPLLGICLLTVCAFLPTFWNGFQMEWDDQWMVMNPLTVSRLDWASLVAIFTIRSHGQWAPVNQLLYTLLFHVDEYNPLVFHAASLAMHLVNVGLLYAGLRMLLAYMSKEQTVVFPLLATLLCLWYGYRPAQKRFWITLVPLYVLALLLGLHEVFWVASYDLYVGGDTYAWWQRLFFCFYSVATYLFKWICPTGLSWMYLFPMGAGVRHETETKTETTITSYAKECKSANWTERCDRRNQVFCADNNK